MLLAIIIMHAVVGWALCAATIGVGRRLTTLRRALIAHAVAAPLIFALVSAAYFVWVGGTGPAATAAIFVAIVILLDVFVVALLIEKSFAMFRSVLGTWLPFGLIFVASWVTGHLLAAPS
jgi:hypothetical protein